MKRILAAAIALVALPVIAGAQINPGTLDPTTDFGARISAGLDWRIADGLHFEAEQEEYLNEGLTNLKRFALSSGLNYKILPYLRVGATYTFMTSTVVDDDKPSSVEIHNRHRVSCYLQGNYKSGLWSASLRETYQATKKAYEINLFQNPQTVHAIKTRLKVAYQIPNQPYKAYVQGEFRYTLNQVDWNCLTTTKRGTLVEGYAPQYTIQYLDRIRTRVGCEWRINKSNTLDGYIQYEYRKGLEIDTNSEGKLKKNPLTAENMVYWAPEHMICLGVAYTFSL